MASEKAESLHHPGAVVARPAGPAGHQVGCPSRDPPSLMTYLRMTMMKDGQISTDTHHHNLVIEGEKLDHMISRRQGLRDNLGPHP